MFKSTRRRERQERMRAAMQELGGLQARLESAYDLFNRTADPELVEASILEISALRSKYGCTLRQLKAMARETV